MPNVSLSGIEFTIKGSADQASNSIDKLNKKLGQLQTALSSASNVNGLATGLKNVRKSLADISNINLRGAISSIKSLGASAKSLQGFANISKDLSDFARSMSNLSKNSAGLWAVVQYLQLMSQIDFSNLQNATEAIKELAALMRSLNGANNSRSSNAPSEKQIAAWSRLKMVLQGIGKVMASPFKNAARNVGDFAKKLGGVASGFKRIVGYRMIRSIIREITQGFSEGIKNLYGWSALVNGKFKTSMDTIATSMLYLKNSIGAAVAPIINALAPAIDFLVDKFVALINVINQLLAKLTGATNWTRAKKKATEYGDAVSGAGAAAKEAMRYLAPFDELNVLPDQKDRGGSGGGGEDYSGMFEDVAEFNEGIANFADAIKDAVNRADWQGLGELLGGKVNEIIDSIDFAGIGQKVGFGINALFSTKYWTLETINFTNIGKKVAEFLTGDENGNGGLFGQVDWNIVGRTLTQKLTIVGNLIIGGLSSLDWGQVASAAGEIIKGAFSQVSEWVQGINWHEFGITMYQNVKDAIAGVDWVGVAESVFSLIGAALGGATAFLAEVAKGIWRDFKAYFLGFIKDENGNGDLDGGEILEGIFKGIGNAFKNLGTWIKDNIWTPFVNGFKSAFGISSPATTMIPYGEYVGEGIKDGIKSVFTNLKNWVQKNILDKVQSAIDKGKEIAVGIKAKFGEWRDEFNTWASGISENNSIFNVTANIVKAVDSIPSAQKIISTVANFISKTIGKRFNNVIDTVSNFVRTTFGRTFSNVIDTVSNFVSRKYGKSFSNVIDTVANFISRKFATTFSNIIDVTANFIKRTTGGGFSNVIDTVANFINRSTGSGFSTTFDSTANFTGRSISSALNTTFDSTAEFTDRSIGKGLSTSFDSTANFTDVTDDLTSEQKTIDVTANITDWHEDDRGYPHSYAYGGVLKHGSYSSIPQFARGGSYKTHGTMFLAGEAGPEVVGHIGGRTEVLNRSQLASTMYSSVVAGMTRSLNALAFNLSAPSLAAYSGNDGGMSEDTLYSAFLRALNDAENNEVIELDGDVVYRKMVQRNRQNTRRTGVNAMAMA